MTPNNYYQKWVLHRFPIHLKRLVQGSKVTLFSWFPTATPKHFLYIPYLKLCSKMSYLPIPSSEPFSYHDFTFQHFLHHTELLMWVDSNFLCWDRVSSRACCTSQWKAFRFLDGHHGWYIGKTKSGACHRDLDGHKWERKYDLEPTFL